MTPRSRLRRLRPAQRRLLRRTAASVAQASTPLATAAISLLAIRVADVATWGAFLGALIVVRLAAQVANFGVRDQLLRAFSRAPGSLPETWRRSMAARSWLLLPGPALFVVTGSPLDRAVLMTAWLVAIFVAQSYDPIVAYRRAFGVALGLELLGTAATCLAIVLIGSGLTADALIAVSTGVAIARAVALAARFRGLGLSRLRPTMDFDELRAGWPFFALAFSGAIGSRVDLYVVAAVLPPAALGSYGLLTNFVLLIQSMAVALIAPIVPPLYRLARRLVLTGAVRLLAIGLPVTLAGTAATWLGLRWLYGVEVGPVALAAAWLAMLPCYLYLPLVHLQFREGRARAVILVNLLGIVVAAVGALVLAPALEIAGAMLAAAGAQIAVAAAHIVLVLRQAPLARAAPTTDALPGV
jgi:O-antigen/teichoic acid export membrane protein